MARLRIMLMKSQIGYAKDQKQTLRALGLRHLRQAVEHGDSPSLRGMIDKVKHLVVVEELDDLETA